MNFCSSHRWSNEVMGKNTDKLSEEIKWVDSRIDLAFDYFNELSYVVGSLVRPTKQAKYRQRIGWDKPKIEYHWDSKLDEDIPKTYRSQPKFDEEWLDYFRRENAKMIARYRAHLHKESR